MGLLGHRHRVLVLFLQGGQLPAALLVDQQQAVAHQALGNVLALGREGDETFGADPEFSLLTYISRFRKIKAFALCWL